MRDKALNRQINRVTVGVVLAGIITAVCYFAVQYRWLDTTGLVWVVMGGAVVQFVVQVLFFLHLHEESKPRWQTHAFTFTILSLLIIVVGSLWIMANMNYNMHITPDQMKQEINELNQKGF